MAELSFNEQPKKIPQSFSMTDEDLANIDAIARFYNSNRSAVIRELVRQHVAYLKSSEPRKWKKANV